ncbi:hypothetical protein B0I72DRAFT_10361 [Yarrowia lipolytica]|uniref:Uncharacterized protein n=1 Tax=Yarrowia lipolytica TaxID=4952 RepID=A0A371BXG2_YARLL|nr:hypothetical protein BKA91DRAFT_31133 [Yarrowia lipolytica]KAE8171947.1 hypothetical protein BKA90DRAFT_23141 [Yarrowia lipolytica]RDW22783.1 hypothetical protein B0I71DRAFT_21680 [Yarrowia lipolytica]RDW30391.1 hypothetical protein B0I72DRAFT_10361 [Yarrowia lipolytica]RDW36903.1 hypothetical protein B0I73DRAFT_13422 [Yarrowia lipolytica]
MLLVYGHWLFISATWLYFLASLPRIFPLAEFIQGCSALNFFSRRNGRKCGSTSRTGVPEQLRHGLYKIQIPTCSITWSFDVLSVSSRIRHGSYVDG